MIDITFELLKIAYKTLPYLLWLAIIGLVAKMFMADPVIVKALDHGLGVGISVGLLLVVMSVVYKQSLNVYVGTQILQELKDTKEEVRMFRKGVWHLVKKSEE